FSDFKVFHQTYAKDPQGLKRLHHELEAVSLRRRQEEVFDRYRADEVPNGEWKLPAKVVIPPSEEGRDVLSPEQVDLLAWISQDPKGWRRWYEDRKKGEKIHTKVTHFTHLQYLYAASIDPEFVGGKGPSPLYEALDRIVEKRIEEGKKIILYG